MGRLHCKRCSKEVHPGRGDYYLVRIEAVADPQPPVITQEDLDQDVGVEIERLICLMTVSSRNICTDCVAFSAGKPRVFRVKVVMRQRQAA